MESAILVPLILYVFLALIFLLLFYLEYSLMQSAAARAVVESLDEARQKESGSDAFLAQRMRERLESAMLFSDEIEVSAYKTGNRVVISMSAAEKIPYREVVSLTGTSRMELAQQIAVSMELPADYLRKQRLAKEAGKEEE